MSDSNNIFDADRSVVATTSKIEQTVECVRRIYHGNQPTTIIVFLADPSLNHLQQRFSVQEFTTTADPHAADVLIVVNDEQATDLCARYDAPCIAYFPNELKEPYVTADFLTSPAMVERLKKRREVSQRPVDFDYPNMLATEHNAVKLITAIIGESHREGLHDTPRRFVKAWNEWSSGYGQDPKDVLKTFRDGAENYDQMIVVRDITFYSHCEHHLAAFFGSVTIGYIPGSRIVGLSKLSRLVDIYAKRLQVQERMTGQIAKALMDGLEPLGCGVLVKARHLCMESRGVAKPGCETVTSALHGQFLNDATVRSEFMDLAKQ